MTASGHRCKWCGRPDEIHDHSRSSRLTRRATIDRATWIAWPSRELRPPARLTAIFLDYAPRELNLSNLVLSFPSSRGVIALEFAANERCV